MKYFPFVLILLSSCYTKRTSPDYDFMQKIAAQAALDAELKTTIEMLPKKYFFGKTSQPSFLKGSFTIKNTGDKNFQIVTIQSNCSCIQTEYNGKEILPGDSLEVKYKVNVKNQKGFIQNSIIAIGNCPFGNQTFYIEGCIF